MIEPIQSGQTLINDIKNRQPAPGEVAIWWLGQSGYAIKTMNHLVYMDLYLSEHLTAKYQDTEKPHIRITRSPLRGGDIHNAKWVFASHKHSDHLDPGTLPDLFAASPDAKLVLPAALVNHAEALGLNRERLVPTRGSERLELDGIVVHSIASAHPGLDYSQENGYPFLGFVLEMDGVKLYHSGDTILYDGLVEQLQGFKPDIVFLPINGTDAVRERLHVPPNMNIDEAINLAQSIGSPLLIPHHYDMFTFNTADIHAFVEKAQAANVSSHVLHCGGCYVWCRKNLI